MRHGIGVPLLLVHSEATLLSSNVRYEVPLFSSRMNAMCRMAFDAVISPWPHSPSKLIFPGVQPPA